MHFYREAEQEAGCVCEGVLNILWRKLVLPMDDDDSQPDGASKESTEPDNKPDFAINVSTVSTPDRGSQGVAFMLSGALTTLLWCIGLSIVLGFLTFLARSSPSAEMGVLFPICQVIVSVLAGVTTLRVVWLCANIACLPSSQLNHPQIQKTIGVRSPGGARFVAILGVIFVFIWSLLIWASLVWAVFIFIRQLPT